MSSSKLSNLRQDNKPHMRWDNPVLWEGSTDDDYEDRVRFIG